VVGTRSPKWRDGEKFFANHPFNGYRMHLLVHSQGNSVVSEAMKQSGAVELTLPESLR
jgi:hypothetical protein